MLLLCLNANLILNAIDANLTLLNTMNANFVEYFECQCYFECHEYKLNYECYKWGGGGRGKLGGLKNNCYKEGGASPFFRQLGGGLDKQIFFIFISVYKREKHASHTKFCIDSLHKNKILMDQLTV